MLALKQLLIKPLTKCFLIAAVLLPSAPNQPKGLRPQL
jgi:hypothetical protein